VDCGTLPNDWLSANIAPVFKKGDVHAAENYRPVSELCQRLLRNLVLPYQVECCYRSFVVGFLS
jgi:uncharacterized Fe-S radical SAM superfamily protein PflX